MKKTRQKKEKTYSKISNSEITDYRRRNEKHKTSHRKEGREIEYKKEDKYKKSHRKDAKKSKNRDYADYRKKRIIDFDEDRNSERRDRKRIKRS